MAARTAHPLDLLIVSARLDAGAYGSGKAGLQVWLFLRSRSKTVLVGVSGGCSCDFTRIRAPIVCSLFYFDRGHHCHPANGFSLSVAHECTNTMPVRMQAFAADLHAVCEAWRAGMKRSNSPFATAAAEANTADIVAAFLAKLEELLAAELNGAANGANGIDPTPRKLGRLKKEAAAEAGETPQLDEGEPATAGEAEPDEAQGPDITQDLARCYYTYLMHL